MNQTDAIHGIVQLAGIGGIDKCAHCGAEYTKGVSAWVLKTDAAIELCTTCLETYYIVQS